jgi:hypothetical protein
LVRAQGRIFSARDRGGVEDGAGEADAEVMAEAIGRANADTGAWSPGADKFS